MPLRLSTGLRNGLLNNTGVAEAFANGIIEVYSGAQPATADTAVSGTLLGTVTVNSGAFTPGVATNGLNFTTPAVAGVLSKTAAIWSFNGVANGTAGWFRFKGNATDAGGASTTLPRMDGSIANSGSDLNLANLTIATGAPTTIDVFTITLPAQ